MNKEPAKTKHKRTLDEPLLKIFFSFDIIRLAIPHNIFMLILCLERKNAARILIVFQPQFTVNATKDFFVFFMFRGWKAAWKVVAERSWENLKNGEHFIGVGGRFMRFSYIKIKKKITLSSVLHKTKVLEHFQWAGGRRKTNLMAALPSSYLQTFNLWHHLKCHITWVSSVFALSRHISDDKTSYSQTTVKL